jgi:hypothetical protein
MADTVFARAWRSVRNAFRYARAMGEAMDRWPAPPDMSKAEHDGRMAVARLYPMLIYRTWLDDARTEPVYEAHVLWSSPGPQSILGQGSTPNLAEVEAREGIVTLLEHHEEHGMSPPLPFQPGRDAILITFSDDGCIRINHVHPATKEA